MLVSCVSGFVVLATNVGPTSDRSRRAVELLRTRKQIGLDQTVQMVTSRIMDSLQDGSEYDGDVCSTEGLVLLP